ncbi:MAG: DUF2785 domain-containing protein [Pseudomonadota bacterium]
MPLANQMINTLGALAIGLVLTGCAGQTADTPAAAVTAPVDCSPGDMDRAQMLAWREQGFTANALERDVYALELMDCFGHPDPVLRDDIGYSGLAALMRSGLLADATVLAIWDTAMTQLQQPDLAGFRQPFAALALAEVVRADRIKPLFTEAQRMQIIRLATSYVVNVRDYRGYSDTEGWRHGVAHGADLLLQLTLNPNVRDESIPDIVSAALTQVAAHNGHFYVFDEPGRLARPVLYGARRRVIANDAWGPMLMRLAQPNGTEWSDAYDSTVQLARLHNTRAFLQYVYIQVADVDAPAFQPFKTAVREALRALP